MWHPSRRDARRWLPLCQICLHRFSKLDAVRAALRCADVGLHSVVQSVRNQLHLATPTARRVCPATHCDPADRGFEIVSIERPSSVKWCSWHFVSHSIPFVFSQANASLGLVPGAPMVVE